MIKVLTCCNRGLPSSLKVCSFCSSKPIQQVKQTLQKVTQFSAKAAKKEFPINGAIDAKKRLHYCYVDPELQIKQTLIPGIHKGSYIMLHGPCASGKSTLMFRAQEMLKDEFICLTVSIQGLNCSNVKIFWKEFSAALQAENQHAEVPLMASASNFRHFFTSANQTLLFGKKFVLFVDDFDTLLGAPQQVLDSIVNTLKAIKEAGEAYCLQSFIGIGPFSILELAGQATSPFNISPVQIQFWTKKQVHHLFKQHNNTIESEIIDDIYERTAGHPGLICIFGKQLAAMQITTYQQWKDYALSRLLSDVASWPTLIKMEQALTRSEPKIKAVRAVLRKWFLANHTAPVDIDSNWNEVKYLAAEGALTAVPPKNTTFRIPSPFIHQFLLQRVNVVDKHPIPSTSIPWHSIPGKIGRRLNFERLLVQAIACINPAVIEAAPRVSWKVVQVPGLPTVLVPQEAVYHTELFAILRAWLPSDVSVFSEINVKNDTQYCNLVLKYPGYMTLLELVATAPIEKIQEHIDRAVKFKEVLNAQEAWVIHFTMQKPAEHNAYTSMTSQDVRLLHVWHNETFTEVEYWSDEEAKFIPIKKAKLR